MQMERTNVTDQAHILTTAFLLYFNIYVLRVMVNCQNLSERHRQER